MPNTTQQLTEEETVSLCKSNNLTSSQCHASESERQATLRWKSTGEHGAETPERETRNRSSAIRLFEGCGEDVME